MDKSNIKYIESICAKKQLKKVISNILFTGLKKLEIEFIYKKLKLKSTVKIFLTLKNINKTPYIQFSYTEKEEKDNVILYDTKNYILMLNVKIIKDGIKSIIKTDEQYNFYIEQIINLQSYKFNKNKCIEIKNWNETISQINNSCYYEAPVGSRKSSERMNLDITEILNSNENNIILMPCDTRSLCNTQKGKMTEIFEKNNINIDYLKNYLKDTPDTIKKGEIRLLICCYDSIYKYEHIKFTHIIIDEYLNVRKRFISVSGENTVKEIHLLSFFDILKNSVAIKCYDADLCNKDLDLLNEYSNKNLIYYKLIDYIQVNNTIVFTNYERQKNEMIQDIQNNKNISVSSNSKKEAEKLYDLLITTKTSLKIALITKDGAKDNKNKEYSENLKIDLTTYTKYWEEYNVIIYTPTIMTGISQDSIKHFYKHYGFLCTESTDHTQTAQMLFRVRNTETNIIMICDIKNKSNLYEYEEYENVENKNYELELIEPKNELLRKKTLFTAYNDLKEEEEINKRQFYYDLFYTLKKWGCNVIKCEFYNLNNDNQLQISRTPNYNENVNIHSYNEFQEFLNLEFLKDINDNNENKEVIKNKDKDKTLGLMKYGLNYTIYKHNQNNEFYNYYIYNEMYSNNNEYEKYKRISKLTFYSVKNVICNMIDLLYQNVEVEKVEMKQSNLNETEFFLNWLISSYIVFILFDTEKKFNVFLNEYLTKMYSVIIINDINKYKKDLERIEKITKVMVKNKFIFNNEYSTLLEHSFKYFRGEIAILEVENRIDITISRSGIPYRIESSSYILEKTETIINMNEEEATEEEKEEEPEETKETEEKEEEEEEEIINYKTLTLLNDITNNDYDDIVNHLSYKKTYKTEYNRDISYSFTPKIRLFNTFKDSKQNKKLIKYFDIYYSNENKEILNRILDNEIITINKKAIKIQYNELYNNIETYINSIETKEQVNVCNEEIILKEGEIYKDSKIPNIKVSNLGSVIYENTDENIKYNVKQHIYNIPVCNKRDKESFKPITAKQQKNITIAYKYIYINSDIFFVDRLICECFLSDYRLDWFIKHKDNDYTNNNIDNLEVVNKWLKEHYKDVITSSKQIIKVVKVEKNKEKRTEKSNEKIRCIICNKMYSNKNKQRHYTTHKNKLEAISTRLTNLLNQS